MMLEAFQKNGMPWERIQQAKPLKVSWWGCSGSGSGHTAFYRCLNQKILWYQKLIIDPPNKTYSHTIILVYLLSLRPFLKAFEYLCFVYYSWEIADLAATIFTSTNNQQKVLKLKINHGCAVCSVKQ